MRDVENYMNQIHRGGHWGYLGEGSYWMLYGVIIGISVVGAIVFSILM